MAGVAGVAGETPGTAGVAGIAGVAPPGVILGLEADPVTGVPDAVLVLVDGFVPVEGKDRSRLGEVPGGTGSPSARYSTSFIFDHPAPPAARAAVPAPALPPMVVGDAVAVVVVPVVVPPTAAGFEPVCVVVGEPRAAEALSPAAVAAAVVAVAAAALVAVVEFASVANVLGAVEERGVVAGEALIDEAVPVELIGCVVPVELIGSAVPVELMG